MPSPAEIVRACLVGQGIVAVPPLPGQILQLDPLPGDASVLCFVGSMPDEPDKLVALYDEAGLYFGRRQRDGRSLGHPGVKIIVRTPDYSGYAFMKTLAAGLDTVVKSTVSVPISDVQNEDHYLQSVYRTSLIISLGEEKHKRRQLWSLHARVAFQDSETFSG